MDELRLTPEEVRKAIIRILILPRAHYPVNADRSIRRYSIPIEFVLEITDQICVLFSSQVEQARREERKAIQDLYQTKEGDIVIPREDWQALKDRWEKP